MFVNGIEHTTPGGRDAAPRSVLAMIYAAARTHGDTVALRCGAVSLSYRAMLAAAQVNAQRLRSAGVMPGELVLCALPTGVELPVAWLAVMLSQAVIVPIDAGWPASRMAAVTAATSARVVIANDAQAALSNAGLALLKIDCSAQDQYVIADPDQLRPDDLLYGFFTSGSTGVPKCALNHHAGIVNRFNYMTKRFGGAHVVYLNSTPLFDPSVWQMLWPLTNGGHVVLPEQHVGWDPNNVVEQIARFSVTMTDFVPTLFKLLVRGLESGSIALARLHSLRNVLIGGEEIDVPSVRLFRRMLPACKVINTYGPTEASIGMVFHEVCDADSEHIPLGRPIDNTFVKIVEADMRPCEAGQFGEIILAGVCVGAGYLNAPELTARAFVDNSFADLPGTVVYRTGDIGRVRPDGVLEYGGRTDDQVKVRGVRVELAEIARAMKISFPEVQDSMALVMPNTQGDATLALVYVAAAPLPLQQVRRALARHLPMSHMPQIVAQLNAFPVSPNGKINRQRLIAELSALDAGADEQPDDSMLERILNCYRKVLLNNQIDADSNFFEMGGDSLVAVNLSLLLETRLGLALPVSAIYQCATPAALATVAASQDNQREEPARFSLPEIAFSNALAPAEVSTTVMLTGASGFIGIHMLGRLLSATHLELVLLLRGHSVDDAMARLRHAYQQAFPGLDLLVERITVVLGDLALPQLGVDDAQWAQLCARVDEIIHCGASINFLSNAAQLFATNVGGTAQMIHLCNEGKGKRLHHISSLAARLPVGPIEELATVTAAVSGYGYTKYLADQLVLKAQSQGLVTRVYRIDDVLPSIQSGYDNAQSLVHMLLKQCMLHRIAPDGCGQLGLLAVDALSAWLCMFVGGGENFDSVDPLIDVVATNYVEFVELAHLVAGNIDLELVPLSYPAFLSRLKSIDSADAILLHSIMPPAGQARVAFTAPQWVGKTKALPRPHMLAANLSDMRVFVKRFKQECLHLHDDSTAST